MPGEQHLHLIFNPTLKVAGETVDGEIHLNFPSLLRDRIDSVYVQLQGFDTNIIAEVRECACALVNFLVDGSDDLSDLFNLELLVLD